MTTLLRHEPHWGDLNKFAARTLELALAIQRIPAPTFEEAARARFTASAFTQAGLQDVSSDSVHNVFGVLPGRSRAGVLLSAHTDTVFDHDTPLDALHRDNGTITAPGLGDNSIGVAALIALAEWFQQQQIIPACDLLFAATSREEGMGDLGGMRAAFDRVRDRVSAVVNVEGLALGHIYNAGIAVRRLRITVTSEGGHSWLHFGQTSAIHVLMSLGAQIAALRPPHNPRTTYNIGVISGGQSVNTIAAHAEMILDLRSTEGTALADLEQAVRALVAAHRRPGAAITVEVVGDRPSGAIPDEHPLVRAAFQALSAVGVHGRLESGSTDGNIPLAARCPTVTIGITRGGNAHRLDEFIETAPIPQGLRQLVLLATAACDLVASGTIIKESQR